MSEWIQESLGEAATPEVVSALSKYENPAAAILGGVEAQKAIGKKMENVIQRPGKDAKDEDLAAYQKTLLTELGAPKSVDDLKGLNLAAGLPEGSKVDEVLAGGFQKFVLDEQIPLPIAQKIVEKFYNPLAQQFKAAQEAALLQKMQDANTEIVKLHGGDEKAAAASSESIRRFFKNELGLTAEQYESVGKELVESGFTKQPILATAFGKWCREKFGEDTTVTGEGGKGTPPASPEGAIDDTPSNRALWPNATFKKKA